MHFPYIFRFAIVNCYILRCPGFKSAFPFCTVRRVPGLPHLHNHSRFVYVKGIVLCKENFRLLVRKVAASNVREELVEGCTGSGAGEGVLATLW